LQLVRIHPKIPAHLLDNAIHRDLSFFALFLEMGGNGGDIQRLRLQASQCFQADQGSFQGTSAAGQAFGQPGQNLTTNGELPSLGLVLEQGQPARCLQGFQTDY